MPKQIEDAEFARLQGRDQLASFIESIYNDPQLGREAKALIKKKYPNIQIPDYDIMSQVEQRFAADKQEREQAEQQRREREDEERFTSTRTSTQQKYGFTDEAMTDLEKFMVDNNVGSYEVAASYRASQNPKPSDATFDDQRWNHAKQEGFKEIAADPEAWGRTEIIKALHNDQERAKQQRF
jgi:hypothetical protein